MLQEIGQVISVIAAGTLKMLVSAGMGVGFGMGFLQTFLFTSIGGCLGVVVFYQLSGSLIERARVKWLRKRAAATADRSLKFPTIFNRRNRWLVNVKHKGGLRALAALTPLVLTIPLGSILAARFFRHDRRTIPALMLSVVLQALCVTALLTGVFNSVATLAP